MGYGKANKVFMVIPYLLLFTCIKPVRFKVETEFAHARTQRPKVLVSLENYV